MIKVGSILAILAACGACHAQVEYREVVPSGIAEGNAYLAELEAAAKQGDIEETFIQRQVGIVRYVQGDFTGAKVALEDLASGNRRVNPDDRAVAALYLFRAAKSSNDRALLRRFTTDPLLFLRQSSKTSAATHSLVFELFEYLGQEGWEDGTLFKLVPYTGNSADEAEDATAAYLSRRAFGQDDQERKRWLPALEVWLKERPNSHVNSYFALERLRARKGNRGITFKEIKEILVGYPNYENKWGISVVMKGHRLRFERIETKVR